MKIVKTEEQLIQEREKLLDQQIASVGVSHSKVTQDVEALIDRWKRGFLDIQPPFQRQYVWDRRTASRLIESILMGHKVPEIQINRTTIKNKQYDRVIDGQQRCTTIFSFIEGKNLWSDEDIPFRLTGCEKLKALNGLQFTDLPDKFQTELSTFQVSLLIGKGLDTDSVTDLFKRLNQNTWKLTPQEIRNAVYQGPFNDLLRDLENNEDFLKLVRLSKNKRMQGAEMIVRFLAFYRVGAEGYALNFRGDLNGFINAEMKFWQDTFTEEQGNKIREKFENALLLSKEVFGETAFSRTGEDTGRVSKVLFEIVMCGFADRVLEEVLPKRDEIQAALQDLATNNAEFITAITNSTSDGGKVLTRFSLWAEALTRILGNITPMIEVVMPEGDSDWFDGEPVAVTAASALEEVSDVELEQSFITQKLPSPLLAPAQYALKEIPESTLDVASALLTLRGLLQGTPTNQRWCSNCESTITDDQIPFVEFIPQVPSDPSAAAFGIRHGAGQCQQKEVLV